LVADVDRDLAKVAVVERHHGSGRIGLGFVRGFGLTSGAFASTVAHDAHNIVVVGVDDESMATCVNRLAQTGGGLAVAHGSEIRGELPLEIAGLMSTKDAATVAAGLGSLEETLTDLGVVLATPFMYLSFLALSVIPELRVTDRGVVDVGRFEVVPLGVA
jgi:adenine deaminase